MPSNERLNTANQSEKRSLEIKQLIICLKDHYLN